MRWRDMRESANLEDRQASPRGPMLGGGVKIGGVGLLVVVVISVLLGQNPLVILSELQGTDPTSRPVQSAPPGRPSSPPLRDENEQFVARILGDTEDTWDRIFEQLGGRYAPPRLVLFRGAVDSACGLASAAVGPFYCPGDRHVYLDISFFRELRDRFGAPGDFARADVIAHEVGHHVQNLMGIAQRTEQQRSRAAQPARNALSVRQELQADCFAGVWGAYARQRSLLEPGDVESGINAAGAIGDDRLQRQMGGAVSPESFTHGSAAQRVHWFRVGLGSGDPRRCDTFTAEHP